ncbi:MAG TPA: CoB--CoM heterodisulfide reductase iron-sulfur subunit A family protein [Bacteroidales bacterium]|nr:CoB--CoM heterodisulfide reductase iron-sulfur subunit A family protein [Bacteroidales bacterium]
MKQRIGVYICHCGGNISDYVDVEQLSKLIANEDNVVISKDVMFACSDSNQKEMIQDIQEKQLDAIVVASCSPKLHTHTFRNVALRAGINPYNYVQVNVREQCSWAHSDTPLDATVKAYGLIRAGINRVAYSEALENIEIEAQKAVAVVGAGVAGMRAAIELARLGNSVYLIEKEEQVGGRVAQNGKLFMTGEDGKALTQRLLNEIKSLSQINLFTKATLEKVSGSIGNFFLDVNVDGNLLKLNVGAVLVTTGFDFYQPAANEYGFGQTQRVITLQEFKQLIENNTNELIIDGRPVKNIAYIYCVGNRQSKGPNRYCSRFCCTAAIHSSIRAHEKFIGVKAFHFYRDIRTYGKQEILYRQSSLNDDVYLKFEEKEPPVIEVDNGYPVVKVKDYLTSKKEIILKADLVVLVTGMVARSDSGQVSEKLKIPIGNDKFFNEIHPKLRPVETVINGVYIGGACQGPKNISESVQSALAGVAKINALLKKGKIALEPIVARVNAEACLWCGKCAEVCDYDAIKPLEMNGKMVAEVNVVTCKGCGICAPVCPSDAIEIAEYSNQGIESMIAGFAAKAEIKQSETHHKEEIKHTQVGMKEYPEEW